MNELLSRKQAAEYLGISVVTFDKIVRRGELPKVLIGRRPKYLPEDLEAYIYRGRPKKAAS